MSVGRLVAHPQIRKLIRCASVSVITTLLSLSVLAALVATRLVAAGWANVVATVAGIGPSYWLNRRWVWGRSGAHSLTREVLPFWALSLSALVLSTLAVASIARWADHAQLSVSVRTAVVLATNVSVFGSLWIAQFVLLDRVLFRPRAPVLGASRSSHPAPTESFGSRLDTNVGASVTDSVTDSRIVA